MNIKRFEHINESSNVNWKEKIDKITKMKIQLEIELSDAYKEIIPLLNKFLKTREEFDEIDIEDIFVKSFEYYPSNTYMKFRIKYYFADDYKEIFYDLDKEEFEDLLEFLNDPELYINSTKYNL